MHVVHLTRALAGHGGMEAVVRGLARWQAARGHHVRIATVDAEAVPGRGADGVEVVVCGRAGPRRWPRARGLVGVLRGADVVHVHGVDGLADQALASRGRHGAPVGVSTHGGYLHTDRQAALKQLWLRTGTRWSLRRADAVWFTSEADREALAPAGLTGAVVPDGVDLSDLDPARRRPEAGRFLVVGRVDVHKGLLRLLRALARHAALDARPFHLEVVGPPGPPALMAGLADLVRALGLEDRVRLRGALPRAELVEAYARCELALFPSRHEGFGLALVEAMAAGVAPVAQPIAAFREKVVDGRNGDLVDFEDEEAAARRLSALRGDRAERDAAAARTGRRWGWSAVGPAWETAYAGLRAIR